MDPVSGMEKFGSGFRDKPPGSATLHTVLPSTSYCMWERLIFEPELKKLGRNPQNRRYPGGEYSLERKFRSASVLACSCLNLIQMCCCREEWVEDARRLFPVPAGRLWRRPGNQAGPGGQHSPHCRHRRMPRLLPASGITCHVTASQTLTCQNYLKGLSHEVDLTFDDMYNV